MEGPTSQAQAAGLTSAVANMIIMIFGYLFHAMIGRVVALSNVGHDALSDISAVSLIYGISVIPIVLLLSAIGFSWMILKQRARPIAH